MYLLSTLFYWNGAPPGVRAVPGGLFPMPSARRGCLGVRRLLAAWSLLAATFFSICLIGGMVVAG